MKRDDLVAQVSEARQSHPIWFDLPSDEPPDEVRLGEFESTLAARLPDDFRWFLKEFGGGDFAFATVFSADPRSDLNLGLNQPPQIEGLVAFSDDGAGNSFVFPVEDGACQDRVLLWDHETSEVRPTGYGNFLDFVSRVALRPADA